MAPEKEKARKKASKARANRRKAAKRGITRRVIKGAERLAALEFTGRERAEILAGIAPALERYEARRRVSLPNGLSPATVFMPVGHGPAAGDGGARQAGAVRQARSPDPERPLPDGNEHIAFAPVTMLSRWIETGALTSRRLTQIYLDRLRAIGPKLNCVAALTEEKAMQMAERADRELARGQYRGPLHGVPWGAKDLLDTARIPTRWGAAPYRDRIPTKDATVVQRLNEAGAVLAAKLSLGGLAWGDVWYAGRTNNPWNPEQGSSGSSAGPAAAPAAGLVGFSIGSETHGSIVSPCMRCGATGLRPTFGRVARTGAMALSWSFDKLGPICRTVEDAALVLSAINGSDAGDPASVDRPFAFDAGKPAKGLRLGYDPAWFEEEKSHELDRRALEVLTSLGVRLEEMTLPDLPYDALGLLIGVEAAAAFEELTLTNRDDLLARQGIDGWPNKFRTNRLVPAVEYVQVQRFRRVVMDVMAEVFADVDGLVSPSFAGPLLLITNSTGHPSLTLPVGLKEDGTPHGITLWGRLFDEETLCCIGMNLERELDVWHLRPPLGNSGGKP